MRASSLKISILLLGILSVALSFPSVHPSQLQSILKSVSDGEVASVFVGFQVEETKRGETTDEEEKVKLGWEKVAEELSHISKKRDSSNYTIDVKQVYEVLPAAVFEIDSEGFDLIRNMKTLLYVEKNNKMEPFLHESSHLIGARQVWDPQYGGDERYNGKGWTVAVLDDGFHTTNPFISSKIVGEGCFVAGVARCPDGTRQQIGAGSSMALSDGHHGTHTSGIVAGNTTNLKGIAPGASLYLINIFGMSGGKTYGSTSDSAAVAALQHIYSKRTTFKFAAVSMSFGGGRYYSTCDGEAQTYSTIISTLKRAGIPCVIASGNNGYRDSMAGPGCVSSAVSVGAVTKADVVGGFSNSASFLTMLAPGVTILSSTTPTEYDWYDGTSMATPEAAGGYAVLRSALGDSMSVDDITNLIVSTGKLVKDPLNSIVFSRIDLRAALSKVRRTCGNSIVEPEEDCDDGNLKVGDGCNPSCEIEWPYVCEGSPSNCTLPQVETLSSTYQLIGDAESGMGDSAWYIYGPEAVGNKVYNGSYSYHGVADKFIETRLNFPVNIPPFELNSTSGRRVFLEFKIKLDWNATASCWTGILMLINGQLVEDTNFPYSGTGDLGPPYFAGYPQWCAGTADKSKWHSVSFDITSFQGRDVQIMFNLNTFYLGSIQAYVDDIYLRYEEVSVEGYIPPFRGKIANSFTATSTSSSSSSTTSSTTSTIEGSLTDSTDVIETSTSRRFSSRTTRATGTEETNGLISGSEKTLYSLLILVTILGLLL